MKKFLLSTIGLFLSIFLIAVICDVNKMFYHDDKLCRETFEEVLFVLNSHEKTLNLEYYSDTKINSEKDAEEYAQLLWNEYYGEFDEFPIRAHYYQKEDCWYCHGTLKRGLFEQKLGGVKSAIFTSSGQVVIVYLSQ